MISSQSQNPYVYCVNNPLRYIDPSGMEIHVTVGGGGQEVEGRWDMETGDYTFFTGPGSDDSGWQDTAYGVYKSLLAGGAKLTNTIQRGNEGSSAIYTSGEDNIEFTADFIYGSNYIDIIWSAKLRPGYHSEGYIDEESLTVKAVFKLSFERRGTPGIDKSPEGGGLLINNWKVEDYTNWGETGKTTRIYTGGHTVDTHSNIYKLEYKVTICGSNYPYFEMFGSRWAWTASWLALDVKYTEEGTIYF